jgi:hypothetical protein
MIKIGNIKRKSVYFPRGWYIRIVSILQNWNAISNADMNELGGNNKKLINNIWIKKEVFGKI